MRLLLATAAVVAALPPGLAAADVAPPRQLSVDPIAGGPGQHETAVEPDSISFGDTIVGVFQVGRILGGGAAGIGWSTSHDGGMTWSSGVFPALTVQGSPPGPFSRASDPAVAYDRRHQIFLANVLALGDVSRNDPGSTLVVSRSGDGASWSAPIVAAPSDGTFSHDKNWIVCDNGTASPYPGRCYVVWSVATSGALAITSSSDGGLTWTRPAVFAGIRGSGWQPLVRPDGTLVVVYETERTIAAVRSADGGASFTTPVTVSAVHASRVPGMRAPPFPSAELDKAGTLMVAWQDCRHRLGCEAGDAPNDIVLASSPDGRRWSRARRVPTAPELEGLRHFVPGLAVDASTRGRAARIAVAFSVLTPRDCTGPNCLVQPYFVSSSTGGRTWSAPQPLASAQPLDAYPQTTGGRFLGDYISTSFVAGGVAVPVFAAASAPFDGRFHQGVFATPIPPLASRAALLRLGTPRVTPARPRVGARVSVSVPVTGAVAATVVCRASGARVRVRFEQRRILGGRAVCTGVLRAAVRNARATGTITVTTPETEVTRRFAFRTG